ncbi:hypothetical protein FMM05_06935 [Flavobacterium zepuense]|uniref:Uncharacterized protein n=1 Tax=Flavobacterium zepuense TaxID=2593302 RepID=A0A552V686_9FLAO|nr:hypothetical protein [Flavobacterium zepuense]TRW25952.1 hypothetical protein FMM05_06935 [Flavobacterium zepuense]
METTQLYIFKTDIGKLCANCEVHKALDNHTGIQQWSIDSEDVDCVLRVSTTSLTAGAIIILINSLGHKCQEL